MKRTIIACVFALLAAETSAGEGDMTTGTFSGRFCGAPAVFELTRKLSGQWVFEGRILIRDTGEYDKLRIEQYSDNSLKIQRNLSGANQGKRQWVFTAPPATMQGNGHRYLSFRASKGNGVGCNNSGASTELLVNY